MRETVEISYDRATNPDTGEVLPATHGHFSTKFYNQIRFALRKAPELMQHMVSLYNSKNSEGDKVDSSGDLKTPLNLAAFNDSNELYQILVYWAQIWAQRLRVRPPSPAQNAWRNQQGTILGLPGNISESTARYQAAIISQWLDAYLDDILVLVASDDHLYFNEQIREVFKMEAKFPMEMKARFADLPCPTCSKRIIVYPPRHQGDDTIIVCEGCERWFEPEQYAFFVQLFEQQKREEMSGANVINHLKRKYGA